jgi:SAM-dependent methyltransferase
MDSITTSLLAEVAAMCIDARCTDAVLAQCQGLQRPSAFNARIHPGDQMLLHSLRHHQNAGAAFSQYFSIALQQYAAARQIAGILFGTNARDLEVLDFACGYGRLLRFLSLAMPPEQLWASELQEGALAFVGPMFGVHTLPSHANPAQFAPRRRFDLIWVASLFSHLPPTLFDAWLKRLLTCLTPRGVLCLSVRDVALLPQGSCVPESGLLYAGESENADLGADIYGTTYASEAYVRRAVRRAAGDSRSSYRLPRALANEQDLYVVAADPQRDLSDLCGFRHGAWGWVDRRSLSAQGILELEGWAASLDDGVIEDVEVHVDGRFFHAHPRIDRPDVVAAFGAPRLARSGWRFETKVQSDIREVFIVVSARTSCDERTLLYVGTVDRDRMSPV